MIGVVYNSKCDLDALGSDTATSSHVVIKIYYFIVGRYKRTVELRKVQC